MKTNFQVKLEKGPSPEEQFCFGIQPQPRTPGEWFALKYPAEVQRWGAPILEATTTSINGESRIVQPVSLNDNFFASIISDPQLGHSVVFYEPEQQWFFHDPTTNRYHVVAEEKLVVLLSALISRCAGEMPADVDLIRLFRDMRSDEVLKPIVKRARAIHSADATFFSADSSNRRISERTTPQTTAKQFILSAVRPAPNNLLSIQDCFTSFAGYCKNQGVEAVERRYFKKFIAEVIEQEYGLGFRSDLKTAEGRYLRGWKGLTVELAARN